MPFWVKLAADRRRRRRHRARLRPLHPRSAAARRRSPRSGAASTSSSEQVVLRRAVRLPVRPAGLRASATACGRSGDGAIIDGLGPDGIAAAHADVAPRRQPAADRLRLSLCLRHADRRRRLVVLVLLRSAVAASSGHADDDLDWPILSLVTFLPLVGAAFILLVRGEPDVVARNARTVALWTSLITFAAVAAAVGRLRHHDRRLPVRREARVDAAVRHHLPHGRRRHLGAVRAALDPADAALHPGELGGDRRRA